MSSDETSYLFAAYYKDYKEKWEMLRMQNHAVISSQSTKKVKVTDIMAFDWDEDTNKISEEDIKKAEEAKDRIKKRFNLE